MNEGQNNTKVIVFTKPDCSYSRIKEQYNTKEIIHLITICGLAGLVQRWTAVIKPEIEADVSQFYRENNLSLDHLTYKFPFTPQKER